MRTPRGRGLQRSVHIFLSLQEFWTEPAAVSGQLGTETLSTPRDEVEMKYLESTVIDLRAAGHQVYLCLNGGISHAKLIPCSEDQMQTFEQSMQHVKRTGVNFEAQTALVRGIGMNPAKSGGPLAGSWVR